MSQAIAALKVFLVVRGVLAAVLCGSVLALLSCDDGPCGNTVLQSVVSPDGRIKAVVFSRDCGATTGYSTQLSLVSADSTLPNESGNTHIMKGNEAFTVRWVANHRLQVDSPRGPFKSREAIDVPVGFLDERRVEILYR